MVGDKYYLPRDTYNVFKGYSQTKLNDMLSKADAENTQDIKMLGWQEIKAYTTGNDLQDICKTVKFYQKYNKEIKCMHKGDIVFPVISALDDIEILYIEDEPEEMYLYDETVIVMRVTDPTIDSKYIYIMLNSEPIKNGLIKMKWEIANRNRGKLKSNRVIPRLTVELLSHIMIVKLTEDERREIVDEYEHLIKIQSDFTKKLTKLQTQDRDKSAVVWFQDNKK